MIFASMTTWGVRSRLVMNDAFGFFSMIEIISPCMFDLNVVSFIECLHTTFETVQMDASDDRRVDMCQFTC